MYFKREDVRRLLMQIAQRSQGLNCFSTRFTISSTTFHEGNQHHQALCHSPHAVGIRIEEIPEFVDAIIGTGTHHGASLYGFVPPENATV